MKTKTLSCGISAVLLLSASSSFARDYDCTKKITALPSGKITEIHYSSSHPFPVETQETKRFVHQYRGSPDAPMAFNVCDTQSGICAEAKGTPIASLTLQTPAFEVFMECTKW